MAAKHLQKSPTMAISPHLRKRTALKIEHRVMRRQNPPVTQRASEMRLAMRSLATVTTPRSRRQRALGGSAQVKRCYRLLRGTLLLKERFLE
jgi:hypothetical protein